MAWSLGSIMIAPKVEALLDESDTYGPEVELFFSRDKARSIICAALWGYGCRSDSDAGAYAFMNLMQAVGVKRLSFKDDWSDIKIDGAAAMQYAENMRKERDELQAKLDAIQSFPDPPKDAP